MMYGLLIKSFRETRMMALFFGTALFFVLYVLTHLVPHIRESMMEIFQKVPFLKDLIAALLGTSMGFQVTPKSVFSFIWVHPTVLALVWGFEIVFCTRVPVGEVDRGTVDLLFGLPVSRWRVFLSETIVWLAMGVWLLGLAWLGHLISGRSIENSSRPDMLETGLVLLNFYSVYIAVGGISFFGIVVVQFAQPCCGNFIRDFARFVLACFCDTILESCPTTCLLVSS